MVMLKSWNQECFDKDRCRCREERRRLNDRKLEMLACFKRDHEAKENHLLIQRRGDFAVDGGDEFGRRGRPNVAESIAYRRKSSIDEEIRNGMTNQK